MEISVDNHTDVLIVHTAICAGASQIALMAEEKSHLRISLRPVANAPERRIIFMENMTERAKETGYSKYTELAMHFQQIISTIEKMREDINVFLILHSEDVQSDKTTVGYKVSTIGQLLDSQYNPVEVVPMVLYSAIKYDDKGNAEYGFYTHRFMDGVIEIPAKSPADMFEEDFIPNDLGIVVNAMKEYYE